MVKAFSAMEDSNRSSNPDIHTLSDPSRRIVLRGGLAGAMAGVFAPWLAGCANGAAAGPLIGFKGVPASTADAVLVPEGYTATPLAPWGEAVGIDGNMPAFRPDASNNAA